MLKQADLVTARREGQQIFYTLNTTAVEDLMGLVMDLFAERNGKETTS